MITGFYNTVLKVTILILIDGFLQYHCSRTLNINKEKVTILILIDGFLQFKMEEKQNQVFNVTILILIDGFLQFKIGYYTFTRFVESQSLF